MFDSLIERLMKAENPDREADIQIAIATKATLFTVNGQTLAEAYANYPNDVSGIARHFGVERYTGSLDIALALAERLAPDHFPGVQKGPLGWGAEMVYPEPRRDRLGKHFAICSDDNWRPHPAIALCIAALRAGAPQGRRSAQEKAE